MPAGLPARTTVVVPSYNYARYLGPCLDAILSQRGATPSLLVIDDASTDDSAGIAETHLAGRDRATLIRHSENLGVVATLNEGLARVDTEFVAFAGADDRLEPDFVARTERALRATPQAALAAAETNVIDAGGRYLGHRPVLPPAFRSRFVSPAEARRLLATTDNFLLGNVTLYRVDRLRGIGGFDPRLGSFCDGMAMRLLAAEHGFHYLAETLGNWRRHGGNQSTAALASPDDVDRLMAAVRAFTREAEREAMLPHGYVALLERRFRFGAERAALAACAYRPPRHGGWHGGRVHGAGAGAARAICRLPGAPLRGLLVTVLLYGRDRPFAAGALWRFAAKRTRQRFARLGRKR